MGRRTGLGDLPHVNHPCCKLRPTATRPWWNSMQA